MFQQHDGDFQLTVQHDCTSILTSIKTMHLNLNSI